MALTPTQIITAKLPALAASANLAVYLELAEDRTTAYSPTAWGGSETRRSMAVALRAMHEYTLDSDPSRTGFGAGGSLQSKKEGELATAFGGGNRGVRQNPLNVDLEQTMYGRQLIALIKGSFTGFGVAGGPADASAWTSGLWEATT